MLSLILALHIAIVAIAIYLLSTTEEEFKHDLVLTAICFMPIMNLFLIYQAIQYKIKL